MAPGLRDRELEDALRGRITTWREQELDRVAG
jgi:hypothetical protein